MNLSLYSAATGMEAQQLNLNTIANNLANVNTPGFKRSKIEFQDLLYQRTRTAGADSGSGNLLPTGIEVGNGSRVSSTAKVFTQGQLTATGEKLDLAIQGEGFFEVQRPDGTTAYTRDGSFSLDPQGQLVTAGGLVVDPGISIPSSATSVSISAAGMVQYKVSGQTALQDAGKIQLTHFINKSGLESLGDNLYAQTAASGDPITANPLTDGLGDLQQGYLEEANVNAVTEISALIAAQRAYEMNSRVVTAADQMQQSTTQMFKG